jgi:hypothetical protein
MGPEEQKTAHHQPVQQPMTGYRRRFVARLLRKQAKNLKGTKVVSGVIPVPDHATARKCYECKLPAMFFRFTRSKLGGIDKSSRQAVCSAHAGN